MRMAEKFTARGKRKQFEKIAGQELNDGSACFFFFFFLLENIQTDCQSLSVLGSERKPPPHVALKLAEEQQNYDGNLGVGVESTLCRLSGSPADNCDREAMSPDCQQFMRNQERLIDIHNSPFELN